ncbi:MAG: hypothetical protein QOD51_211 [Candidatus Eremiobacteraeota bacterium]|nr:hypothetical protein [Candidatus Eremiobacteraeota bacterium]
MVLGVRAVGDLIRRHCASARAAATTDKIPTIASPTPSVAVSHP